MAKVIVISGMIMDIKQLLEHFSLMIMSRFDLGFIKILFKNHFNSHEYIEENFYALMEFMSLVIYLSITLYPSVKILIIIILLTLKLIITKE